MATPIRGDRPLTPEEYLAFEESSPERHEYVDGEVYAMSGVTRRHSRIALNVALRLLAGARDGPCRVHRGDVKLQVGRVYYYPDDMVACGAAPEDERLEDAPCLVVEVLSESTWIVDQREKLMVYRTIPSLRAYLIIDQELRRVERHYRDESDGWRLQTLEGRGEIPIPCPALTLTLDEIYEGVELPPRDEVLRIREEAAAYR